MKKSTIVTIVCTLILTLAIFACSKTTSSQASDVHAIDSQAGEIHNKVLKVLCDQDERNDLFNDDGLMTYDDLKNIISIERMALENLGFTQAELDVAEEKAYKFINDSNLLVTINGTCYFDMKSNDLINVTWNHITTNNLFPSSLVSEVQPFIDNYNNGGSVEKYDSLYTNLSNNLKYFDLESALIAADFVDTYFASKTYWGNPAPTTRLDITKPGSVFFFDALGACVPGAGTFISIGWSYCHWRFTEWVKEQEQKKS